MSVASYSIDYNVNCTMLDIDNILSKGVGPLIARTKHNATEAPRTINVAKNIIYLNP